MSFHLPHSFADASQLPFNRAALAEDFQLETPCAEPEEDGFWLLLQGTRVLVTEARDLPGYDSAGPLADNQDALYIGRWRGKTCRLRALTGEFAIPKGLEAVNILAPEPQLPLSLLSLAGVGNAILHWEKTSRCCDNCGGKMIRLSGEWGKRCESCTAQHYPRIHPCVIVLVRRGKELLLVRKPEWAPGRFGLVAGFVEFGENLEQCVEREVREETGLEVRNIRYLGSQSWPFPSQLMTGFSADYAGGELKFQDAELVEGGWYAAENLPQLPARRSIARWLIDTAVEDLQNTESMIES